jgi:hypothetical protein
MNRSFLEVVKSNIKTFPGGTEENQERPPPGEPIPGT